MGLVPRNVDSIVKLKDNVTDSEKWVSKTGPSALLLNSTFALSLCRTTCGL
jgi:hypothetical protein